MVKKVRTTLSLSGEILQLAHEKGLNISRFLENALRSYLEGGSQQGNGSQQQPQSLEQPKPEQPNQTPNMNFKTLFPAEALEKLKAYGFNINDNDWLKRVIRDSLQKTIVELGFEVWDPKTGAYVLLE